MIDMTAQSTVPQLVRERAAEAPDAVAVLAVEAGAVSGQLTYHQLWYSAGKLADRLAGLPGHRPGALVATLFPRGAEAVVAQLAVWRAGGAYLPLDGTTPEARRTAILSDARPLALLSHDASAPGGVALTTPAGATAAADRLGPEAAYVVYTSGSTGTPKGIEVAHPSLANLVDWHARTYRTGPGVRVATFAGPAFDASVWETWATLANGATLVVPRGLAPGDVQGVRDALAAWEVEQCFLSTPLAERFLELADVPATLKVMTTGGDKLRIHPRPDFPAGVFNHYGPTEATVVTTASGDLRAAAERSTPVIGRPIQGAEVLVVAADGTPVTEPDTVGELLIGGRILATGYLRDQPLTDKLFGPRPDGGRWYSSGDLCRWTPDGSLEFVGRRDLQIAVRGHRVEATEIERAALRVDGVDQVAVVARDTADGTELVGFYAGAAGEAALRAELAGVLPGYMVPAELRRVDALPLNTSGKIDRAALGARAGEPAAAPADGATGAATAADGDPVVARVSAIWAEVLGRVPAPGDNFFDIGGQSLKAARVLAATRKQFGIAMPFDVMFTSAVFSEFVARVTELLPNEAE
ncbi:non-ribosomal peptide synthetase [Kitasatospora sp. NPDC047058]|uniref:non-ribosomal peptide synthetase n=1 Tax=Kitasatospora sp. NPDC047058 TaxID=3155620 RepID=UPI0033EF1D4E